MDTPRFTSTGVRDTGLDRTLTKISKKVYFLGGKLWRLSYFVEAIGNNSEQFIRALCTNSAQSDG